MNLVHTGKSQISRWNLLIMLLFKGGLYMYLNSGYMNNSVIDFKDKSRPLIVGSCGTYRLITKYKLPTYRPRGRIDYQLIYISSGKAYFHFEREENETIVTAGNMVIFRPKELQKYEYYGKDKTEVYWVHFTGSDVKNILRKYGIKDNIRTFFVGASLEYERIFKKMISELQRCQEDYKEILSLLMLNILISIHRELLKERKLSDIYLDNAMDIATQYFSDNYNTVISIEEYAKSCGMSISWFIRNFKKFTGTTPMQYIVSIRIANAQLLLETTQYTISEISGIVGYDNPLYFSRLFHKQKGVSPSDYRKETIKLLQ